jgi:hypothetical protein
MKNDLTPGQLTVVAIVLSIIALTPWIAPKRAEAPTGQDNVVAAISCQL